MHAYENCSVCVYPFKHHSPAFFFATEALFSNLHGFDGARAAPDQVHSTKTRRKDGLGLVDAVKAAGVATVSETIMNWQLHLPPRNHGSFAVSWTHISKVLSIARARALGTRWEVTTECRALEVLRTCLCPVAQVEAISGDERKRTTVTAPPTPTPTPTPATTPTPIPIPIPIPTPTPTTVFPSLPSPTFFGEYCGILMHGCVKCVHT
jgi:hypothetical protein